MHSAKLYPIIYLIGYNEFHLTFLANLCGQVHRFSPPLSHAPPLCAFPCSTLNSIPRDRTWYLVSSLYIPRNFPNDFLHVPFVFSRGFTDTPQRAESRTSPRCFLVNIALCFSTHLWHSVLAVCKLKTPSIWRLVWSFSCIWTLSVFLLGPRLNLTRSKHTINSFSFFSEANQCFGIDPRPAQNVSNLVFNVPFSRPLYFFLICILFSIVLPLMIRSVILILRNDVALSTFTAPHNTESPSREFLRICL